MNNQISLIDSLTRVIMTEVISDESLELPTFEEIDYIILKIMEMAEMPEELKEAIMDNPTLLDELMYVWNEKETFLMTPDGELHNLKMPSMADIDFILKHCT